MKQRDIKHIVYSKSGWCKYGSSFNKFIYIGQDDGIEGISLKIKK